MHVAIAETICSSEATEAWSRIVEHRGLFIWSDDENPATTWNAMTGAQLGASVRFAWTDNEAHFSYRDRRLAIPLVFDREDALITLHSLAQIVRPDSDLRLCRDSAHSSDKAFLALSPQQWLALEGTFSPAIVAAHFCSLNQSYAAFMQDAFPGSSVPPGTLDASLKEWGGPGYAPSKLDYVNLLDSDDQHQLRTEVLSRMVRQYIELGQVEVRCFGSPNVSRVDRDKVLDAIRHRVAKDAIRLSDSQNRGFVVIEDNGAAAGWRIDGRTLDPQDDKPWWRFWDRAEDRTR